MATINRLMIDYSTPYPQRTAEPDAFLSVTIEITTRESYRVDLIADPDASPYDADCYSEADIEAWRADEWQYIGVIVTPLHVPEAVQDELSYSVWGLEWNFPLDPPREIGGRTYRRTNDEYQLLVYPVPDMIDEVRDNVDGWRLKTAIRNYVEG